MTEWVAQPDDNWRRYPQPRRKDVFLPGEHRWLDEQVAHRLAAGHSRQQIYDDLVADYFPEETIAEAVAMAPHPQDLSRTARRRCLLTWLVVPYFTIWAGGLLIALGAMLVFAAFKASLLLLAPAVVFALMIGLGVAVGVRWLARTIRRGDAVMYRGFARFAIPLQMALTCAIVLLQASVMQGHELTVPILLRALLVWTILAGPAVPIGFLARSVLRDAFPHLCMGYPQTDERGRYVFAAEDARDEAADAGCSESERPA